MNASAASDAAFYWTADAGLVAAALAGGLPIASRKAYAAAFASRNPKHALSILHAATSRADEAILALQHFKAHAIGLMSDIEAALPVENTTETAQP